MIPQSSENDYHKTALQTVFSDIFLDIYEITYAYSSLQNGNYLNTTLFGKLIFGDSYQSELADLDLTQLDLEKLLQVAGDKINEVIQTAQEILNGLRTLPQLSEQGRLLMKTLEEKICILKMTHLGLPFEAEKAGLVLTIEEEKIYEVTTQISQLDAQVFGKQILESPEELKAAILRCKEMFEKKGHLLNKLQQQEFLHLCEQVPEWKTLSHTAEHKKERGVGSILNTEIPRENYIQIFQGVFDIYGLKIPILEDERSSIYDGETALYIPIGEKYDYLSVKKILTLIAHEIETHYIIADNNHTTLGFRSAGNIFRDEGLAIIMENILSNRDISHIPISENMIFILYGQLLPGSEFHRFLELYYIMIEHHGFEEKFRRSKRNYPRFGKGVQLKDSTYSRGLVEVRKYLASGKNPKALFYGKIGLADLDRIRVDENRLKFPIGIAHILQFYLLCGGVSELPNFLAKLKEQFLFFDIELSLNNDIQGKIQKILELIGR